MDKRTLEIAAQYMALSWPHDWPHAQKMVCKYIMGLGELAPEEIGLHQIVWC